MDFSRGTWGRLEWKTEIGRRFKPINDMLDWRNSYQAGLRFPPEGGRSVFWRLYGNGASNHGLDAIVYADVVPSVLDRFIMHSTV